MARYWHLEVRRYKENLHLTLESTPDVPKALNGRVHNHYFFANETMTHSQCDSYDIRIGAQDCEKKGSDSMPSCSELSRRETSPQGRYFISVTRGRRSSCVENLLPVHELRKLGDQSTFGSMGSQHAAGCVICGVGDRLKQSLTLQNLLGLLIFAGLEWAKICGPKIAHYPLENGPHYPLETRPHYPLRGLYFVFGTVAHFLSQYCTAHFSMTFVAISRNRCCPIWPLLLSVKFNLIKN